MPSAYVDDLPRFPIDGAPTRAEPAWRELQRQYFGEKLYTSWKCEKHGFCWVDPSNEHHIITPEMFRCWVDDLCEGDATIRKPPKQSLQRLDDYPGEAGSPKYTSTNILSSDNNQLEAISRVSTLESMAVSEAASFSSTSSASSFAPGIGHVTGKGLVWIGEKLLNGIIFVQLRKHKNKLTLVSEQNIEQVHKRVIHLCEYLDQLSRQRHLVPVKRMGLSILRQLYFDLSYLSLINGNKDCLRALPTLALCMTHLGISIACHSVPHAILSRHLRINFLEPSYTSLTCDTRRDPLNRTIIILAEVSQLPYVSNAPSLDNIGLLIDYRLWTLVRDLNAENPDKGIVSSLCSLADYRAKSFDSFKSDLSCLSRAYELAVFSLLAEEHVAFMAAATNRATGYPRILTSLYPAILELSSERSQTLADWFAVSLAMDAILQTVLRKPVIFEQAEHEIEVVFELMGLVMHTADISWELEYRIQATFIVYALTYQMPSLVRPWASTNISHFKTLILANLSYFHNTVLQFYANRFNHNVMGLVIECCRDLLAYIEMFLKETNNAQDTSKDESLKRRMPPRNLLLLMTLHPVARGRGLPNLHGLDMSAE